MILAILFTAASLAFFWRKGLPKAADEWIVPVLVTAPIAITIWIIAAGLGI